MLTFGKSGGGSRPCDCCNRGTACTCSEVELEGGFFFG